MSCPRPKDLCKFKKKNQKSKTLKSRSRRILLTIKREIYVPLSNAPHGWGMVWAWLRQFLIHFIVFDKGKSLCFGAFSFYRSHALSPRCYTSSRSLLCQWCFCVLQNIKLNIFTQKKCVFCPASQWKLRMSMYAYHANWQTSYHAPLLYVYFHINTAILAYVVHIDRVRYLRFSP